MLRKQIKKNRYFIYFIVFIILFLSTLNNFAVNVSGEQFRLEENSRRFYLTNLDVDETWTINVTALFEGKFYLYIFDERPLHETFLEDDTDYPNIGSPLVAMNETPQSIFSSKINNTVNFISLNFTAEKNALHYLEIIIVENGPDTFILQSSSDIQSYYIPFIPGYDIKFILFSTIFAVLSINIRNNRKNKLKK